MSSTDRERHNKVRKEKYATEPEKNLVKIATRKELHQKERDIKERKKQENIALALKGLNCKGRKEEPGNDNAGESEMKIPHKINQTVATPP